MLKGYVDQVIENRRQRQLNREQEQSNHVAPR